MRKCIALRTIKQQKLCLHGRIIDFVNDLLTKKGNFLGVMLFYVMNISLRSAARSASKTCNKCGFIHQKLGKLKHFKCPQCQIETIEVLTQQEILFFDILLSILSQTPMSGIGSYLRILFFSLEI